MDSTIFDLDRVSAIPGASSGGNPVLTFKIPTLSAYAIDYSDVLVNGLGSHQEGVDFEISGNSVIWNDPTYITVGDKVRLTIYYHGIRDYCLLFPRVANPALVERLARFYEEAEKVFRSGAWLSYALMCGAIFEGLLFGILYVNRTFNQLIQDALVAGRIDAQTSTIMHKTRQFRNLVHSNRFMEPYITRIDAMDIRTVMDKLIKNA